jgi:DNA (cytosine-5)-methyltransferase 1
MRAIDLFCGTGGFSRGAHAAGFEVAAAFDFDPILTDGWATNFPQTKLKHCDISQLSGPEIEKFAGAKIDLLFGGPPCQGFSSMGRRDKKDERRKLLGHFFRLVSELKPSTFVMENVRGLGFANARCELEDALKQVPTHYAVSPPMILDAANFGAATNRRRLFIIGYDPRRCAPIDFEGLQERRDEPATVREAIEDLANARRIGDSEADVWELSDPSNASKYAQNLHSEDKRFTGNRRTSHTKSVLERFLRVPQGGLDTVGRYPRLSWEGQCPTLRAGTGADKGSYQAVRPLHPDEDRVITVREAARLQGFPDTHRFHETIWHSFRMIGNSVSPIIAEAVLRSLAEKLELGEESKKAA